MKEFKIIDGRIQDPESDRLEYKRCRKGPPRDLWPNYSAFANTFGGTILLGVSDKDHEVTGVEDPEGIVREIWDILNNSNKVSVNILSPRDIKVIEIDGRDIIQIDVPRAERRRRPVYINGNLDTGTYKRNGEGDYHCSVAELKQMLRDASESAADSSVLDNLTVDDLDAHSVSSFRERMSSRNPSHPWNDRPAPDLLRLMGAAVRREDGYHPTLAGLLMFGYDYSIMEAIPNYHLDYLEYGDGTDGWTYRRTTGSGEFTGNLYNFLTEVSNRISVVSDRSKEMDGVSRIDDNMSIRAQRELLVNALVNADYSGYRGVRAERRPGSFTVRNPGCLRIPVEEMFEGGISDPRNPHIALMLGLIGMGERAGSGVSEVVSFCRSQNITDPMYTETSDPETVTVRLMLSRALSRDDWETAMIDMIRRDPKISLDRLAENTGLTRSQVIQRVNLLKARGRISRSGGTRGHWEIS